MERGVEMKRNFLKYFPKALVIASVNIVITGSLVGCNTDSSSQQTTETTVIEETKEDTVKESSSSTSNSSYSSSSSSSSTKSVEHYCEADGCYKEGTHKEMGLNGYYEYYCDGHWQEVQDIINMMEEDVGSDYGHTCEECSKAGTNELIGLSGATEYYCTEHYNEIIEILSEMLSDN